MHDHGIVLTHPHEVDGETVNDAHTHGNHDDSTPCYGADHPTTWMGFTPEQEDEAERRYGAAYDHDKAAQEARQEAERQAFHADQVQHHAD